MADDATKVLAMARRMIKEAREAETDALALQHAEDAARLVAETVSEEEPSFHEVALAILDVWERRDLYAETARRAVRAAKVQQSMARILMVSARQAAQVAKR